MSIAITNTDHYSNIADSVRYSKDAAAYESSLARAKAERDSIIDGSITSIESDVTVIKSYKFNGCTSLVSVDFPNVTHINDAVLKSCSKLETAVFDKATYIGLSSFQDDTKLKNINIRNIERISTSAFWNCSNLNTIVLEKRAVLDRMSAFQSCPAIIYVKPEDLSWYSTATNWSTLYVQNRIKSIEDLTGDDLAWYQEQLARYQEVS